jgi:hypothetical protein
MPIADIGTSTWKFSSDVVLADREFNKPEPIDVHLGAQIIFALLGN